MLGGTGTVGSRLVHQLAASPQAEQYTILAASRNGSRSTTAPQSNPRVQHVTFNWHDADTWNNPFSQAVAVDAVYLIAPPALDSGRLMTAFIDFARARGVRRFVLQSASSIEAGGPAMGKVHAYLRELGEKGEVEWAALRPTWFQRAFFSFSSPIPSFHLLLVPRLMCGIENFAVQPAHAKAIREESKIYSATGGGKIPWVSADDIAAVAVRALTGAEPPNTDYLVLGAELLSYGEVG